MNPRRTRNERMGKRKNVNIGVSKVGLHIYERTQIKPKQVFNADGTFILYIHLFYISLFHTLF